MISFRIPQEWWATHWLVPRFGYCRHETKLTNILSSRDESIWFPDGSCLLDRLCDAILALRGNRAFRDDSLSRKVLAVYFALIPCGGAEPWEWLCWNSACILTSKNGFAPSGGDSSSGLFLSDSSRVVLFDFALEYDLTDNSLLTLSMILLLFFVVYCTWFSLPLSCLIVAFPLTVYLGLSMRVRCAWRKSS